MKVKLLKKFRRVWSRHAKDRLKSIRRMKRAVSEQVLVQMELELRGLSAREDHGWT